MELRTLQVQKPRTIHPATSLPQMSPRGKQDVLKKRMGNREQERLGLLVKVTQGVGDHGKLRTRHYGKISPLLVGEWMGLELGPGQRPCGETDSREA